jgi:hypothetical protein
VPGLRRCGVFIYVSVRIFRYQGTWAPRHTEYDHETKLFKLTMPWAKTNGSLPAPSPTVVFEGVHSITAARGEA